MNVPLPDEVGRGKIMAVHLRKTPMASPQVKERSCAMVASVSGGMSGADLANVCNEAALLAGRRSALVRPRMLHQLLVRGLVVMCFLPRKCMAHKGKCGNSVL